MNISKQKKVLKHIPKGCMATRAQSPIEVLAEPTSDIFKAFILLIEVYFTHLEKPFWLDILKVRYGLDGSEPRTLSEVGEKYKITRERVRQIVFVIIHQLKKLMEGKSLKTPRIVCKTNKTLFELFEKNMENRNFITKEDTLHILKSYATTNKESLVVFLMDVYGYQYGEIGGSFFFYKASNIFEIKKKIKSLRACLSKKTQYTLEEDIKKELGALPEDLAFYFSFMPDMESKKDSNGVWYRFPLKDLYSLAHCVYRILDETGYPMHLTELGAALSKAGVSYSEDSLHILCNYKGLGIESIGRTGRWVLTKWKMNTATIPELLEQTFMSVNRPLRLQQLVAMLNKIRDITPGAVSSSLSTYRDKFIQYSDGSYGMKDWKLKRPEKIKRVHEYKHQMKKDDIVDTAISIIKNNEGRMLLTDLIDKLGDYSRPTIYASLSQRSDLFFKERFMGRRSCYIKLVGK